MASVARLRAKCSTIGTLCVSTGRARAQVAQAAVKSLLPLGYSAIVDLTNEDLCLHQQGSNPGRSGGCQIPLTTRLQWGCGFDERGFVMASKQCTTRVVEQCSFGLHKRVAANWKSNEYRSHFGSRYTLGCCSHAGLFVGAFGLGFSIWAKRKKPTAP